MILFNCSFNSQICSQSPLILNSTNPNPLTTECCGMVPLLLGPLLFPQQNQMEYLVALKVKNLTANAGDINDVVPSLGQEDPLEEHIGTPLQYSRLENPMDRGAWQATVHGVAESQTRLKRLSMHAPAVQIDREPHLLGNLIKVDCLSPTPKSCGSQSQRRRWQRL